MARVKDAESATLLTAEGQALFQADDQKLTAYAYCSQAINLAEEASSDRQYGQQPRRCFSVWPPEMTISLHTPSAI